MYERSTKYMTSGMPTVTAREKEGAQGPGMASGQTFAGLKAQQSNLSFSEQTSTRDL